MKEKSKNVVNHMIYRKSKIFQTLILILLCAHCSSHPGWIRELPGTSFSSQAPSKLIGLWERKVRSRYSVANKEIFWQGREWIEIGKSSRNSYEKYHLYADFFKGIYQEIAYAESGLIKIKGRWILFQTEKSKLFRNKRKKDAKISSPSQIRLPDYKSTAYKEIRKSPPLLFLADKDFFTLTPLTYERFGTWFEHGIHEGFAEAYDYRSDTFKAVFEKYNSKTFHEHSYRKKLSGDSMEHKSRMAK